MTKRILFFLSLSFLFLNTFSQTTVNSLLELKPYLAEDNVNIKLAPGTYSIDASDISNGNWGYTPHPDITYAMSVMLFTGSNSTYDFTGVTILFNTDLFTAFGKVDVWEVHITGNNNTLKNLTMIDDGSVDDAPRKGVTNVVMDGANNVIEGFHVTAKGSFPYAYGDSFGKGSGSTISHQKHSGILLRGLYNTLRNTTHIHRAFGHCVFMQGADHPTIEGCYIEGEMRSTDDMWTEKGTGSPADEIDFITTWGYELPRGYMKALCEEGIRSYNAGETILDGVYITDRGSNDITLKNNTVKNARIGCSIVLSSGSNHIENINLIGCEGGFMPGSTDLINCAADCIYGAAYLNAYDTKRNTVGGDLTILPPSGEYMNGGGVAVFLGGENSNLNIHDGGGAIGSGLEIRVGGNTGNVAHIETADHTASGNSIFNYTRYPVVIQSESNNNDITSCSTVTDNGSGNTISATSSCDYVDWVGGGSGAEPLCVNTTAHIEAECLDEISGAQIEDPDTYGIIDVGSIKNGYWAKYSGIDLTGMNSVSIQVASAGNGGIAEIRLHAVDGELIGSVDIPNTGSWDNWQSFSANIERVSGEQDIYLVFRGGGGWLYNVDYFGFSEDVVCFKDEDWIEAECYDDMSGIQTENCSEGTKNVGWIQNTDWTMYSGIDLTGMNSFKARMSGKTTGSSIEVRLDAPDGELVGQLEVSNTKSNQNWVTDSINITPTDGVHNIYLVFFGGTGYLYNINKFCFSEEQIPSTQTLELVEGWNLISLYVEPENRLTGTVFPNATIVKTFDSFYSNSQADFLNTLTEIEAGKGYLVYNDIDEAITISGVETHGHASLQDGWNLIGVPSPTAIPVTDFPDAQIIKDFECFYEKGDDLSSLQELIPGKAYFILK